MHLEDHKVFTNDLPLTFLIMSRYARVFDAMEWDLIPRRETFEIRPSGTPGRCHSIFVKGVSVI